MNTTKVFLGDNLRLSRLISGQSQNDLGEKVGTTRQYIQKLERDSKTPSDSLIESLAYELNLDTAFFFKPINNHIKEEECHFRKLKTASATSRRECIARATLLNKVVDSLSSKLKLPQVNFPIFEVDNLLDTERAAIETRKHWGLGDGPIKSMIRVLENAGAITASFGSISEKVDALSVHRNRPIVLLNQEKSSPRIRMDLAHECAHIIMHDGIETGDNETEDQADHFAAAFLLPRQALLREYGVSPRKKIDWEAIKQIKIKWGVSSKSIVYRLRQLDIINPTQYRAANINFSRTRQTRKEWYDEYIPIEKPELLGKCIDKLFTTYGSNMGGILTDLGISIDLLFDITQQNLPCNDSNQVYESENVTDIFKFIK